MRFLAGNGVPFKIKLKEIVTTLETAYHFWDKIYDREDLRAEGLIMQTSNETVKWAYKKSPFLAQAMNSVLENTMLLDTQVVEYLREQRNISKILYPDGKGVLSTDLEYVIKLVKYMGLDTIDREAIRENLGITEE